MLHTSKTNYALSAEPRLSIFSRHLLLEHVLKVSPGPTTSVFPLSLLALLTKSIPLLGSNIPSDVTFPLQIYTPFFMFTLLICFMYNERSQKFVIVFALVSQFEFQQLYRKKFLDSPACQLEFLLTVQNLHILTHRLKLWITIYQVISTVVFLAHLFLFKK